MKKSVFRMSKSPKNVLVVDDDPLVLSIVMEMLKELGCHAEGARTPNEGLKRLTAEPSIDILITDVNMPEMNGYALAERALAMRRQIRVLLLSGREGDGRGFPLLRKPFGRDDLARIMDQTTGRC